MGLFFDQDWFDERLRTSGQTKGALAQAAGMSLDEVEMVFRDQRELEDSEVMAFARVLSADPSEVANRSGAPEPGLRAPAAARPMMAQPAGGLFARPGGAPPDLSVSREVIAGLHERIDRLERLLELVIRKLDQRQ
jgi:hypothetical protein